MKDVGSILGDKTMFAFLMLARASQAIRADNSWFWVKLMSREPDVVIFFSFAS